MSTSAQATVLDRLVSAVPRSYRVEVSRFARRLRDRFPPIAIGHRIDGLERQLERRLKDVESKLDDVLRRLGSRPG